MHDDVAYLLQLHAYTLPHIHIYTHGQSIDIYSQIYIEEFSRQWHFSLTEVFHKDVVFFNQPNIRVLINST